MNWAGQMVLLLVVLAGAVGCGGGEEVQTPVGTTRPVSKSQITTQPATKPVVRPWTMGPVPTEQVNLLIAGDWGSNDQHQAEVAGAMADYVQKMGVQFHALLSTGDNFCVPVSGIEDPLWGGMFEDMYDARRLAFPFYMALGNHDYDMGGLQAELGYGQVHPQSRWKMPARWYRVDFPEDHPLVTVLVLDSDAEYLTKEQWFAQMHWMDQELGKPGRGRWTICVGHHPLFSNGSYGDNLWLAEYWGPLFQKHKVDFYACGHNHGMEHLQVEGYFSTFLISGGGGREIRPMIRSQPGPFSRSMYGFVHLQLRTDGAAGTFISDAGREFHRFRRTTAGKVSVE